ncbi:hypothetical protein D3C85_1805960 [compost metagenome]
MKRLDPDPAPPVVTGQIIVRIRRLEVRQLQILKRNVLDVFQVDCRIGRIGIDDRPGIAAVFADDDRIPRCP